MASAIARFAATDYTNEITVNKRAFIELDKMFNVESAVQEAYVEW
jgi:hypothetical protein